VQRHGQPVATNWAYTVLAPIYLDEPRLMSDDPGGGFEDGKSDGRGRETWSQIREHLDQALTRAD
jgi:hypothetical protein